MPEIHGTSVLILGYGREGKSTHKFLLKTRPDLSIAVADKAEISLILEAKATTRVFSGNNYLSALSEFSCVIHSPGLPINTPPLSTELSKVSCLTTATNLFFELCPGKIVGVTGTKGKSTTSSLIAALLKTSHRDVRFGGNIGTSMLDLLHAANSETVFVLELSSFQLEDLRRSPHFAVLLDIVPEHLDHHGSFDSYLSAKASIARHQSEKDHLFIHANNSLAIAVCDSFSGQKILFSEDGPISPANLRQDTFYLKEGEKFIKVTEASQLKLRGDGNLKNILAALSCAQSFGVTAKNAGEVLRNFQGLPHRLQEVGVFKGVTFINDSLSTIPEAAINAVSAFTPEAHTLIAGGYDRGLDFKKLGLALAQSCIREVILFPGTREKIFGAVQAEGNTAQIQFHNADSMEEAVRLAYAHTPPGKVCLMSPASSSFNMFRDYQERGDQFTDWVRKLGKT